MSDTPLTVEDLQQEAERWIGYVTQNGAISGTAASWIRDVVLRAYDLRSDEYAKLEREVAELRDRSSITQNDKRWRFLEHGCQWVSWTPINGKTVSFDPRNVTGYEGDLNDMRGQADIELEKQLVILRNSTSKSRAKGKP